MEHRTELVEVIRRIRNRWRMRLAARGAVVVFVGTVLVLLLSASTDPVPDIVALVATPRNDGILHIPGPNAAAAFAVATVNLGAGSPITVAANTGSPTLPLALLVCQINTNTATSICLAPPTARVTTTIDSGSKPTFGIFGISSGTIPFDPANNRVFVTFSDPGGAVRGSTSVAVTTTQ